MTRTDQSDKRSSYAEAGVDIDAGQDAVRLMGDAVRSTWDENVLGRYGAFAGLYSYSERDQGDVLAVTIDGVGTKLKVAVMCGTYASVGMDLVNHCTDDLLVQRGTRNVRLLLTGPGHRRQGQPHEHRYRDATNHRPPYSG